MQENTGIPSAEAAERFVREYVRAEWMNATQREIRDRFERVEPWGSDGVWPELPSETALSFLQRELGRVVGIPYAVTDLGRGYQMPAAFKREPATRARGKVSQYRHHGYGRTWKR